MKSCMVCLAFVVAVNAFTFNFKFTPHIFELSSKTDTLIVSTNAFYYGVHYVYLDIGNKKRVRRVISPDSSEYLVVRCGREDLKEAVGDFDSLFTDTRVMITIDCDGVIDSASQVLRVRK